MIAGRLLRGSFFFFPRPLLSQDSGNRFLCCRVNEHMDVCICLQVHVIILWKSQLPLPPGHLHCCAIVCDKALQSSHEAPTNPDKGSHAGRSLVVISELKLMTYHAALLSQQPLYWNYFALEHYAGWRASCRRSVFFPWHLVRAAARLAVWRNTAISPWLSIKLSTTWKIQTHRQAPIR